MFSPDASKSRPSAEKKSLISRLRPWFQRSKRIAPDTAYAMIVQQPDGAFSSSALPQFTPSLPLSPLVIPEPRSWERNYHAVVPSRECSTPGVPMYRASGFPLSPPTFPIIQRTAPYMGSPPTFLPLTTPSSGYVGSSARGVVYPLSPGWPEQPVIPAAAVRSQTGSRHHYGLSGREHRANSSTRMSRQSRLWQPAPPFGLYNNTVAEPSPYLAVHESRRHNTTHSVGYEVVTGRQNEQHKQIWQEPRKRKSKPPSAEYLATPLSDNPLGLFGMVPGYVYVLWMKFSLTHIFSRGNYDVPQDIAVAPRHHHVGRHTAFCYPPGSAVRALTIPQVSSQNAGQRRDWDAYPVNPQCRPSRRGTSSASQEYTSSYDR
jgi:hypothetical protein